MIFFSGKQTQPIKRPSRFLLNTVLQFSKQLIDLWPFGSLRLIFKAAYLQGSRAGLSLSGSPGFSVAFYDEPRNDKLLSFYFYWQIKIKLVIWVITVCRSFGLIVITTIDGLNVAVNKM